MPRQVSLDLTNSRHGLAEQGTQSRLLQVSRQAGESVPRRGQFRRQRRRERCQVAPMAGKTRLPLTRGSLPVYQIDRFRLRIDQDVIGVEIAVSEARFVKGCQQASELAGKSAPPCDRGLARLEEAAQVEATGQFAEQEECLSIREFARGNPVGAAGEVQSKRLQRPRLAQRLRDQSEAVPGVEQSF